MATAIGIGGINPALGIGTDPIGDYTAPGGTGARGMPSWVYDAQQPQWSDVWNPSMSIADDVEGRLYGPGYDRFASEAMRTGPSPWANLMNQQSFAQEDQAMDSASQQQAGALAEAESNLAMRGGLSSGARERLQSQGGNDILAIGQDVSQQGAANRMQIGINDEQNRIAQLGMLPGMEMQRAGAYGQASQFDVENQFRNNLARNAFDLDRTRSALEALGARETARATEAAGGGFEFSDMLPWNWF